MEKVVPFRTGYGSGLCAAWYDGSFLFFFVRLTSAPSAVAQGNLLYMFAHANTQSGADGRVSGIVEYDVFGKVVTETGVFAGSAGSSGGISALVFAYAGKPYDPVTGLSDYGFRDYAPTLARFTTVDPIRDGSNWYAYCNSDPVNYVDMWGLCESDNGQKEEIPNPIPLWGSGVTFAQTQLDLVGENYVWGGDSIEENGGLDCSGAVLLGLRQLHPSINNLPDMNADTIVRLLTEPTDTIEPGILGCYYDSNEDRYYHVQTIINEEGHRVNATGDKNNTKDNPGTIELITSPLPDNVELRKFKWMTYNEEIQSLHGERPRKEDIDAIR